MDEWIKIQRILLGYIFSNLDAKFLSLCVERYKADYFTDLRGKLWGILSRYFLKTACVLSTITLREICRAGHIDENTILDLENEADLCKELAKSINENDMPWFFDSLVQHYKQIKLQNALEEANNKLKTGGFLACRDGLLADLGKLDDSEGFSGPDLPISEEISAFIRRTQEIKEKPQVVVNTGFPILDANLAGLSRGDVFLVAGFTSVGKTALMINFLYNIVFKQNKNLVYITTETIKDQVTRRLISRISRDKDLFQIPVASRDLKSGKLGVKEWETINQISNLIKNPKSGKVTIVQAPMDATMAWLRGKLLQLESQNKVDVVILDELRHMRPSVRRGQEWEEFNDLMKSCKGIARTHAGRGVVLISPYQVGRIAFQYALTNDGKYNLTALSGSAEAERTSDIVVTLWEELEQPGIVRLEILKMRDGPKGATIPLVCDFSTQFIYERDSSATGNQSSGSGFNF